MMRVAKRCSAAVRLGTVLALWSCGSQRAVGVVPGGDPGRGESLIYVQGCGSCHTIPGVTGARGTVGPPLARWSRRDFIAGELPNTPDNLVRWIVNAPAIEPGTDMPNLGLSEAEARDIAAYLYTLR
jgi:cytochrome c